MSKTIIIIGAGLAGLSAALQAAENGCNVKLVSSLPSERAQSVMAEGGINAALNTKDENDSPEEHFTDTIKAACGLADPNAVWGMTQAAPELVHWLLKLGVKFNMSGYDDVDLRNFGGQKKKRTAFAQSDTGKQIMTAMIDAVRRKEASGMVERFSHHSFLTLRLCGNICCGCVIRDGYSQETVELPGDAVIVATGGMHGLFGNTTGSLSNTGEVTAELFRLGVPLANGEMIQYHPTTVKCGGKRMLISEAARGEGGRLFAMKDGKQWYFMEEKYPELGNLMPRDITAREIWKVSHESEVFLDMTEISEEIISNKLSGLADDCMTYLHKDIRKEPVSVLPGIHYFMGGILVDEQHRLPDRVIRRRRVRSYPLSSSEDGQQSENRKSVYTLAHLQSSEKIWPEHTANAGRDSCKSARLFRYSGYFLPKCRLSQDKTFQSAEASPPEFYIRECPLSTEPVPGHDSSHNFRQSS